MLPDRDFLLKTFRYDPERGLTKGEAHAAYAAAAREAFGEFARAK